MIPSTKRGFKGMFETVVEQACRNCTNIKNRQNKARDNSLKIIEQIIAEEELLNNQIIMVKLDEAHSIDKNLTGLVATKIASQYQKPTLILNKTVQVETINKEDGSTQEIETILWSGSGRIFAQSAFTTFRKFLDESGYFEFAQGHEGAFGCAIKDEKTTEFTIYANETLANFDFSQRYFVDLLYDAEIITGDDIFQIANYDGLWGQGVEEPFVVVNNIRVTTDNI
jgi:single-stranded-DNA-specific exonuclease